MLQIEYHHRQESHREDRRNTHSNIQDAMTAVQRKEDEASISSINYQFENRLASYQGALRERGLGTRLAREQNLLVTFSPVQYSTKDQERYHGRALHGHS